VFVIARNSVFTYKGKPVKVQRVAEELGVRYVLEGSVRRAGDQMRISAQLINATTGGHLWAERYDGKVDNVFDLQDEITGKIIASLALQLTPDERKSIERPETTNVAAYDAYLQGWEHLQRHTAEEFAKALPYLKNAIELDSGYGQAYAALAWLYYQTYQRHWHKALDLPGRPEALHQANRYLEMATKYATPLAHRVTADKMWQIEHKFDEAILEAKRAVALDSGNPVSHTGLARALTHAGRAEEAIDAMKTAMRLDPHYPPYYLYILGLAYFTAEQFEESSDVLERALDRNPDFIFSTLPLMAAYAQLGRLQEAKAALAKFSNVMGRSSIQGIAPHWPFKNPSDADRFLNGLRKAGVPEKSEN
jgi:tetratricopeptide (TPR) repeat protein